MYVHHLLPPLHTTGNEYHNPHYALITDASLRGNPYISAKEDGALYVEHALSIFLANYPLHGIYYLIIVTSLKKGIKK
jgi:hypothetical protein